MQLNGNSPVAPDASTRPRHRVASASDRSRSGAIPWYQQTTSPVHLTARNRVQLADINRKVASAFSPSELSAAFLASSRQRI